MKRVEWLLIIFLLIPATGDAQRKMVKILVSTPYIENKVFQPISDVMAGTIIREFKRVGGMDILEKEESEQLLKKLGMDAGIEMRDGALEAGEALGADIVIYSAIRRQYDFFYYSITFLEVEKDIIQRVLNGSFKVTEPPSRVGKIIRDETQKLLKYVPLPSELNDPGVLIREVTIDPQRLPPSAEIDDLTYIDRYGHIEQIFNYYRVFPGEIEYQKFEKQKLITRLSFREDLDSQLTSVLNYFYICGDFAIRHNLQAYLIKDCSVLTINLLLANKIPVFFTDGILIGYTDLSSEGFCLFKTIEKQYIYSTDLTYRKRMAVLFMVPKPGRKKGVTREYLESSVGFFHNEQGMAPTLIEIKDSMLDIGGSMLE